LQVAVISDIHGNAYALDLVLKELQRNPVNRVVCLGDTIQGGAQPAETVEALRRLACPIVMGNADAWLLSQEADTKEPTSSQQKDVRLWTLSKLSSSDLDFIRSYSPTISVELGPGRELLGFHGSPASFDDVLLPTTPDETWETLLGGHRQVLCGGHTHTQQLRRVGRTFFFNPGSVGLAHDIRLPKERFHADPWAEYAVLAVDGEKVGVDFRRVPYELEEMLAIVKASGRPHYDRLVEDYRPHN